VLIGLAALSLITTVLVLLRSLADRDTSNITLQVMSSRGLSTEMAVPSAASGLRARHADSRRRPSLQSRTPVLSCAQQSVLPNVRRECGMALELEDVPVHSLVPEPLRGCATADEYLARLPEHDGDMAAQLAEASAAGECLRYVGAMWLTLYKRWSLAQRRRSQA